MIFSLIHNTIHLISHKKINHMDSKENKASSPPEKQIVLGEGVFNDVVNYLVEQKYKDVVGIINSLAIAVNNQPQPDLEPSPQPEQ